MDIDYFRTLARYNRWANHRLYAVCAELAPGEFEQPRAAFFGSIKGTLNHLIVGDRAWLDRLEGLPAEIHAYDQVMGDGLESLWHVRQEQDARLIVLVDDLGPEELAETLHYISIAGDKSALRTDWVLAHMFNHQTHHRGQAHGLLSQTTVVPPPFDVTIFLKESANP